MIRSFLPIFILVLFGVSCQKLGVDYPYESETSLYSEAYNVSLIMEPINYYNDPRESMVMGNLQNGTSYTFLEASGLGYEMHLAPLYNDLQDSLFLSSISFVSKFLYNSTLWNANDLRASRVNFTRIYFVDTNLYLLDAVRDEYSFKHMLASVKKDTTIFQNLFLDKPNRSVFSDSVRYYAFESYNPGTRSDSRNLLGVLMIKKPTKTDDFIKVYVTGRVMYEY